MTDPQRAAFEAYARSVDEDSPLHGLSLQWGAYAEEYVEQEVQDAWEIWQAAQAADAGREPVAYETMDANGDQELFYASYLARCATEEERNRFMVPLYTEPNAYRLAAINAELVEALEAAEALIAKNAYPQPDKPNSAWSVLQRIQAALTRAKEQKS